MRYEGRGMSQTDNLFDTAMSIADDTI
ncbi:phage tail protein, partial [Salmonella enterica]|nr:phage tail protein [Salmonella enterica]